MTESPQAELLPCGLCYREDGEAVHPHPECPIGRPRFTVTKHMLRMLIESQAERPVLYLARSGLTGAPIRLQVWSEPYVPHHDIILRQSDMLEETEAILDEEEYEPGFLADYQEAVNALLVQHLIAKEPDDET